MHATSPINRRYAAGTTLRAFRRGLKPTATIGRRYATHATVRLAANMLILFSLRRRPTDFSNQWLELFGVVVVQAELAHRPVSKRSRLASADMVYLPASV